jgi:probable HAF family extracellular repeat protein
VKTRSLISGLAMLALVIGAQRGVTAAGDSQKKPPAQDSYTITQLDIGANVASSGQLISDNQVVAGNLQGDSRFAFAWSAQTGFVVLTLGGSSSLASGMSANGIVSGAADTPDGTEVLGFIWTPANGLVTIGDLGGGYTVPQGVNSSGVVISDATTAEGRDHAFMWTEAGGMVDLDPTGLDDSAARFVTEDGGLIIGSIYPETGQRIFAWTKTTGLVDIGTLGRDMLPDYITGRARWRARCSERTARPAPFSGRRRMASRRSVPWVATRCRPRRSTTPARSSASA